MGFCCVESCGEGEEDCLGRWVAREWRRKEMKEVLPLFLAPITRALEGRMSVSRCISVVREKCHVLEGRRIFPPPHAARAVDVALGLGGATGVRVATAVSHALGAVARVGSGVLPIRAFGCDGRRRRGGGLSEGVALPDGVGRRAGAVVVGGGRHGCDGTGP